MPCPTGFFPGFEPVTSIVASSIPQKGASQKGFENDDADKNATPSTSRQKAAAKRKQKTFNGNQPLPKRTSNRSAAKANQAAGAVVAEHLTNDYANDDGEMTANLDKNLDYPIAEISCLGNVKDDDVVSVNALCHFPSLLVPVSQLKSNIPLPKKYISEKEATQYINVKSLEKKAKEQLKKKSRKGSNQFVCPLCINRQSDDCRTHAYGRSKVG